MNKFKFIFISLFGEKIKSFLDYSVINKPIKNETLLLEYIDLREFGVGKHKQIDEFQYGPGKGMVLMVEPIYQAIQKAKKAALGKAIVVLLTPQGKKWNQNHIPPLLNNYSTFIFISGNYEGFDERIRDYVDLELSIGDYVLSGGELPALVIANTIIRMLPNTIKNESKLNDSFNNYRLDYPVYTKPLNFNDKNVPKILISGHHQKIAEWRKQRALYKTWQRRPDLLKKKPPTLEEQKWIKKFTSQNKES